MMAACVASKKKAGTAFADPAFLHAEHCQQDYNRGNDSYDHQNHLVASIQSFIVTNISHIQAPK
jgi:hypothetical protein